MLWPGPLSDFRCAFNPTYIFTDGVGAMKHRHLNHEGLTLAAIDDIIQRGGRLDWAGLRRALLAEPSLADKILRVCEPYLDDPYNQRHHFWKHYVEQRSA